MLEINKEEFNRNLLLTQAYCELQMAKPFTNSAKVLRSFNPENNGKPIFSFGKGQYNSYYWNEAVWNIDPFRNDYLYQELFEKQILNKQAVKESETVYEGRILIANIDQTVTDGASETESDGFIDIYDCPPIDTWFYMGNLESNRMLFAWIPKQFEKAVQGAIDVNCMDCLGWYNDGVFFENNNGYVSRPYVYKETHPPKSILTRILEFFKGQ